MLCSRTESVAEKMLTNWFTFLLYKFLKVGGRGGLCGGGGCRCLPRVLNLEARRGQDPGVTSPGHASVHWRLQRPSCPP